MAFFDWVCTWSGAAVAANLKLLALSTGLLSHWRHWSSIGPEGFLTSWHWIPYQDGTLQNQHSLPEKWYRNEYHGWANSRFSPAFALCFYAAMRKFSSMKTRNIRLSEGHKTLLKAHRAWWRCSKSSNSNTSRFRLSWRRTSSIIIDKSS